jgi:allantoinase
MKEFLLYSKRCWIDGLLTEATLHIGNGKINSIYHTKYRVDGIDFFDFQNAIVMPGIIDAHVHINEPGRTHWEGFDSATKAAAIGGVTTLIEMPLNANPVTTNVSAFELKKQAAKNKLHVHCGFYGGVVPGNEKDIEPLINAGVFGIKGFLTHSGIDEFSNVTKDDLEKIAPILAKKNVPLLLHCEVEEKKNIPQIQNKPKSYRAYLASRPTEWELNALKITLDIQEKYSIKTHIVHLSSAKGLQSINYRKKQTEKLTVETCPHYLFFNAENIPDASPIYKCAPPIRGQKNNDALWEAVLNGEFNFLASDHSPAPPELKKLEEGNLFDAWGGIAGLQFTLPVLWTAGVKKGLTLEKLIPLLTENPAKFLGLTHQKGKLQKGFDADITVWNENEEFTVTENNIAHKHKATPYLNHRLKGKIIHTFVEGAHVVENGVLKVLHAGNLLLKK